MNTLILFCSNKCRYSNEILQNINKDANLVSNIKIANIDNNKIKIPPYITNVPSLLIIENNKKNILVGDEIINWVNKNKTSNSILDFDKMEMCGFSDKYSYLDGPTNIDHNFVSLNHGQNIITVSDNSVTSDKKNILSQDYERLMAARKNDTGVNLPISRK